MPVTLQVRIPRVGLENTLVPKTGLTWVILGKLFHTVWWEGIWGFCGSKRYRTRGLELPSTGTMRIMWEKLFPFSPLQLSVNEQDDAAGQSREVSQGLETKG